MGWRILPVEVGWAPLEDRILIAVAGQTYAIQLSLDLLECLAASANEAVWQHGWSLRTFVTSCRQVSTCRRMRRHSTALPVADIVFRNSANHKLNGLLALRPYVGMGRIIKRTSWGSTRN